MSYDLLLTSLSPHKTVVDLSLSSSEEDSPIVYRRSKKPVTTPRNVVTILDSDDEDSNTLVKRNKKKPLNRAQSIKKAVRHLLETDDESEEEEEEYSSEDQHDSFFVNDSFVEYDQGYQGEIEAGYLSTLIVEEEGDCSVIEGDDESVNEGDTSLIEGGFTLGDYSTVSTTSTMGGSTSDTTKDTSSIQTRTTMVEEEVEGVVIELLSSDEEEMDTGEGIHGEEEYRGGGLGKRVGEHVHKEIEESGGEINMLEEHNHSSPRISTSESLPKEAYLLCAMVEAYVKEFDEKVFDSKLREHMTTEWSKRLLTTAGRYVTGVSM